METAERDDNGEWVTVEVCLNCGHRAYLQPLGKAIAVVKGQMYR